MGSPSRRQLLRRSLALAGLGLLADCSLPPLPGQQPAKVPRIGVLTFESEAAHRADLLEAFRAGLRQLGHVEGRTVAIDFRFAEFRPERYPELAAELVRQNVAVIVTAGTPAALAARRATSTIPIVMAYAGDPVAQGLVASLARPGENVTGLTTLTPELAPKRLELLKGAFPAVSRVGVLYRPDDPGHVLSLRELEGAARTLGVEVRALEVGENELAAPLAAAISERVDALVVVGASPPGGQRQPIIDFAARQRLPTMYLARDWVDEGGLMAYGVNFADLFRRAAAYVDKILKGASPAELPVERPTRFDFVINLRTAQALGLTLPQSVLLQATEIIQ